LRDGVIAQSGDCVLRLWFVSALVLGALCSRVEATCVDPSALVRSTVSITRTFDDQERKVDAGVLGVRGTAWFLSSTSMVTAGHVATAMNLSDQKWTPAFHATLSDGPVQTRWPRRRIVPFTALTADPYGRLLCRQQGDP
jgi:hypothetical protein